MGSKATAVRTGDLTVALPTDLVVDLDGTLTRIDTLHETFALALFTRPLAALRALLNLPFGGRARFKADLCAIAAIDAETPPLHEEMLAWLRRQRDGGRRLHLATAADSAIAQGVAQRLDLFDSVHASDGDANLKGAAKAQHLAEAFPDGFCYAGDSAVWAKATTVVVVVSGGALERRVRAAGHAVEQGFTRRGGGVRGWLKAARLHQWSKNVLVLVPVILGWPQLSQGGLVSALAAMVLMSLLASLTYLLNDIADLTADRRHWSKRHRPFAAGGLPVLEGLFVAGIGIPVVLALGWLLSPAVASVLAAYGALTLAYSLGLKRVPLLDAFLIGTLFTLRLTLGVVAAGLVWSVWLLTFSMFFFFSLAMAKRHTELLRAAAGGETVLRGRGYLVGDRDLTLAIGVCAAMASILILVLYLMDEVFPAALYALPGFLWAAPAAVFLWVGRIWLLAHRGQMTDDPVVFALTDKISLGLGGAVVLAFLLALL